ncbi:DUF1569 domain-containing protein [Alkalicoccobacillus gibsonii]|uniref:DUF1569 domain-containing protein n=1 Tax=Alkalicoccobacillus gibsonii TaxID=79881 RepID=UPI0035118A0D
MKTLYDQSVVNEVLTRLDQLTPQSQPVWGKMNVSQMLAHCSIFQDLALGNRTETRSWLGLLVGKFASPIFFNDKPLPKNMSTLLVMDLPDHEDFIIEKEHLKQKLLTFQQNGPDKCSSHPHPFFGRLTPEQWGKGVYKHVDHHLKQFNA